MNNKTVIEFGFRIIWRIMEISSISIILRFRFRFRFLLHNSIWWTNNEGFFEPISQRVAWAGTEKNCSGFGAKNWHFYGDLQRRRYRWGEWGINSTNFQLWDNSDLCSLRCTLVWQAKNPWTRWSYTAWGDRCCHSYKTLRAQLGTETDLGLKQMSSADHKIPTLLFNP